jgi:hypothetical protein
MSGTPHPKRVINLHVLFGLSLCYATATEAFAHGAERGLIMLLPTHYYALGALVTVALSFLILTSSRASNRLQQLFQQPSAPYLLRTRNEWLAIIPSLLSSSLLFFALYCGHFGPSDPLSNILPLVIWTGWWVGFTLLQVLVGDLWQLLNPWRGIVQILARLSPGRIGQVAICKLPKSLGYAPAIALFFCFAWFELVSAAPEDPQRLALAVGAYWLLNFIGILIFGLDDWLKRAEPFSVFFRLIGGFSPIRRELTDHGPTIRFQIPGAQFLNAKPLPLSGICLVLLILGTATFDGVAETFTWFSIWGINPLEYAGRSSMQSINTIGLILTPLILALAYFTALWLGLRLTGEKSVIRFAGSIVYSIIPISIAFHAAHYLTLMLINGQYLLKALSDPLGKGWNIFGGADLHVTASMVQNIYTLWVIWTAQVIIITLGHAFGIILAHMIAMDWFKSHGKAAKSQIALAALMVFYTVFGLWLLSTPTIG